MLLRTRAWLVPALMLLSALLSACSPQEKQFPSFVYATAGSLAAYRAAASLPQDVMTRIPCYCGCNAAPALHKSLRDCFYNSDGSYNEHAAGCDLCGRIALDVKANFDKGKDVKTIRALIDSKYSIYGEPTDTPLP